MIWITKGIRWLNDNTIKYRPHDKISDDKDTGNKHEYGEARKKRDQGGEKKKKKDNWTPRGGKKKK